MKRDAINPTKWGLQFGMNQAELVRGITQVLHCSGQTSLADDSNAEMGLTVTHQGDMRGQIEATLKGIDALLDGAGMNRSNILHVRFYTTDLQELFAHYSVYAEWIGQAGIMPPQTMLGVAGLAMPELLIEIEITAGK